MTDLTTMLDLSEPDGGRQLSELRLSAEASTIILFTKDGDEAAFHYERSPDYRGHVVCPGGGCPLCYLGDAPQRSVLLPIYDLESRSVCVLRVPIRKDVGALAPTLAALLGRDSIADSLVLIRRDGYKYWAETRPLPPSADRGAAAIQSFVDAGIPPRSAFMQPTAADLAELERVRTKLDIVGGWQPPTTTSK